MLPILAGKNNYLWRQYCKNIYFLRLLLDFLVKIVWKSCVILYSNIDCVKVWGKTILNYYLKKYQPNRNIRCLEWQNYSQRLYHTWKWEFIQNKSLFCQWFLQNLKFHVIISLFWQVYKPKNSPNLFNLYPYY